MSVTNEARASQADPYASHRDAPTSPAGATALAAKRRRAPALRKTPPPPPPRPRKESKAVEIANLPKTPPAPPPLPKQERPSLPHAMPAATAAAAPVPASPVAGGARPPLPWPPPAFPLALQPPPRQRPTFADQPMLKGATGGTAPPPKNGDKRASDVGEAARGVAHKLALPSARSGAGSKWFALVAAVIVGVLVWRIEQMSSSGSSSSAVAPQEEAGASSAAATPDGGAAVTVAAAATSAATAAASVTPHPPPTPTSAVAPETSAAASAPTAAPAPTSGAASSEVVKHEVQPAPNPSATGEMVSSPLLGAYRAPLSVLSPPARASATAGGESPIPATPPNNRVGALAGAPTYTPMRPVGSPPPPAGRNVVTPAWAIPGAPPPSPPHPPPSPAPARRGSSRPYGGSANPNVDARSIMNAANPLSPADAVLSAGRGKGRVDVSGAGSDRIARASEQIDALLKKPAGDDRDRDRDR